MEASKKNFLFKLGPLIFLPKQTEEEKQQAYHDNKPFYRNVFRLAIIFSYGMLIFALSKTAEVGRMFTEPRPLYYYLIFAAPLVFSIMDWRVIREAIKSGIPVTITTRILIYGVWLVSTVYYLIYAYRYFSQ